MPVVVTQRHAAGAGAVVGSGAAAVAAAPPARASALGPVGATAAGGLHTQPPPGERPPYEDVLSDLITFK